MKPRRCIKSKAAEVCLFMPLLAVLAVTVSWVGLCMFLFDVVNMKWEKEIPMRLHVAGSSELLPDRDQSPVIVIRENDEVEWEGKICSNRPGKSLSVLREKIRAYLPRKNSAKIVIMVEANARYQRMIDVLDAFLACNSTHYHMVILPEFVGPRVPNVREPEELPESLRRRLELGF